MCAVVTAGFGVKIEWGLGLIFYLHSVIGRVVNFVDVIYGVRTSLFLTSQRMPSRYGCDCKAIQLMILSAQKISIGDIFCEIFYNHTYGCMLL